MDPFNSKKIKLLQKEIAGLKHDKQVLQVELNKLRTEIHDLKKEITTLKKTKRRKSSSDRAS